MKRFLFSVLLLTLVFALTCGATDTRVLTLGNTNNILRDDANIFLFPQTINMYRGLAVGDVSNAVTGGNTLYRLGAHYDLGQTNGVVGVYVDNRPLEVSPFLAGVRPLSADIGNRLNLFYGVPLGGMDFGVNLVLFHNSLDSSANNGVKQSNTDLGLNLGLTVAKNLELAAGFNMDTWTNKDAAGAEVNKPKSNLGVNVGARYWWGFSNDVDFVPHVNFGYMSEGYSANNSDNTSKTMALQLGWGVNIRPVDRVLLLFDLGVNYDNNKVTIGTNPDVKSTFMDLPYYKVGLEGHVTRWWDVRLGAEKAWAGSKIADNKVGTTDTNTYLGSGFHFGNLTVDAQLNPNFVLNGPNFVSGQTTTLAYQASILYTWK